MPNVPSPIIKPQVVAKLKDQQRAVSSLSAKKVYTGGMERRQKERASMQSKQQVFKKALVGYAKSHNARVSKQG